MNGPIDGGLDLHASLKHQRSGKGAKEEGAQNWDGHRGEASTSRRLGRRRGWGRGGGRRRTGGSCASRRGRFALCLGLLIWEETSSRSVEG